MAEIQESHASSVPAQGEVDTTRPFRSVKEAIAVFGERCLLTGDAHNSSHKVAKVDTTPRPVCASVSSSPNSYHSSTTFNFLRKLEAEVEEMKQELIRMKARESQTAKTIATLRSKLEATESAQSVDPWQQYRTTNLEEGFEYLPSLRQVLSIVRTEERDRFGERRIKLRKKKPIVPLVGDVFSFSRKKGADVDLGCSSFYSRSSINSFT